MQSKSMFHTFSTKWVPRSFCWRTFDLDPASLTWIRCLDEDQISTKKQYFFFQKSYSNLILQCWLSRAKYKLHTDEKVSIIYSAFSNCQRHNHHRARTAPGGTPHLARQMLPRATHIMGAVEYYSSTEQPQPGAEAVGGWNYECTFLPMCAIICRARRASRTWPQTTGSQLLLLVLVWVGVWLLDLPTLLNSKRYRTIGLFSARVNCRIAAYLP